MPTMPATTTSLVTATNTHKRTPRPTPMQGEEEGTTAESQFPLFHTGLYSASDVDWKEHWTSSQETSIPARIQELAPIVIWLGCWG